MQTVTGSSTGSAGVPADADEAPGDAPPAGVSGEMLAGRYELGPLIGQGATARVYRGRDHARKGATVAVKLFHPGVATAVGMRGGPAAFAAVAGLAHPGLVDVCDTGATDSGQSYIVMEFVDGPSVAAQVREGPMPATTVAALGARLARVLAHVHAHGLVHRDIKPANVLLDPTGRPRLVDFGIARLIDATAATTTGVAVGTPAYMAPEQVRGERVGPAADVYALGLVLLEAVTGQRAYDGSVLEVALARLHRPPHIPADVDAPLAAVLHRMTATDPADRPSASAVAAALTDLTLPTPPARTGRALFGTASGAGRLVGVAWRAAPAGVLALLLVVTLVSALAFTRGSAAAGGPAAAPAATPTRQAVAPPRQAPPAAEAPAAPTAAGPAGAAPAAMTPAAAPAGSPSAVPAPGTAQQVGHPFPQAAEPRPKAAPRAPVAPATPAGEDKGGGKDHGNDHKDAKDSGNNGSGNNGGDHGGGQEGGSHGGKD